jgi:hypothetical protein
MDRAERRAGFARGWRKWVGFASRDECQTDAERAGYDAADAFNESGGGNRPAGDEAADQAFAWLPDPSTEPDATPGPWSGRVGWIGTDPDGVRFLVLGGGNLSAAGYQTGEAVAVLPGSTATRGSDEPDGRPGHVLHFSWIGLPIRWES